jgi:hypothetical protein
VLNDVIKKNVVALLVMLDVINVVINDVLPPTLVPVALDVVVLPPTLVPVALDVVVLK